jgi:hypothetical protein
MQLNRSTISDWTAYLEAGLGLLALWLLVAVLAGWPLPFALDERAATFWLATLGIAMCTLRLNTSLARLGWFHPINLLGAGLGALLVLAIAADLAGARLPLGPRALFVLTAALLYAKWALGLYARRFLLPPRV